jgi:hypothetical protein
MPEGMAVRRVVGRGSKCISVPGKARQAIGMNLLMTDFVCYCGQHEQEITLAARIKQILAGMHTHKLFSKPFLQFDTLCIYGASGQQKPT